MTVDELLTKRPITFWYENEKGDKWVPEGDDLSNCMERIPAGFDYQHSRFPNELSHNICTDKGQIARFNSTFGGRLVEWMIRDRSMDFKTSVLIAAIACERCMNVLYHAATHGDEGYVSGSEEWHRAGTSCELCRPETA